MDLVNIDNSSFFVTFCLLLTYIVIIVTNISSYNIYITSRSENIKNSSLFLIGLSNGILVPILISTNEIENRNPAETWLSNGTKLGLRGSYSNGTFSLTINPNTLSHIRSISYVGGKSEDPPIPIASPSQKMLRTYLITTELPQEIILYEPNGPSQQLSKYKVIEDSALTYTELTKMAMETILGKFGGCGKPPAEF